MRSGFFGRLIALLLPLVVLWACHDPEHRRIVSDENEGGIIGTGIIGTITGIGSIEINGLRVTYDADLEVQSAFGSESPENLAPGDTIMVEATLQSGVYRATSIERYQPIIAPIEAIADDRSWVQALGVRILIDRKSPLDSQDDHTDQRLLRVGAWIAVDGIWKETEVVASNIRQIARPHLASVRGVAVEGNDGALLVGPVRVINIEQAPIDIGGILAVQGTITRDENGSALASEQIAVRRFSPGVRHVRVEGFASDPSPDGAYTIYGSGLTAYSETPGEPMDDNRSLFSGTLDDIFIIEDSTPLQENLIMRK